MLIFLTLLFIPAAVSAEEYEDFHGTWGTPQQCAREPIQEGGTVMAEPIEIGPLWMRQGPIWCRLSWFPIEEREDGLFSGAQGFCGEDAVRGYWIGMLLRGDELRLRWDFFRASEPLQRCPVS